MVSALSISDDLVHLTPLEASEHIEDYQPPAEDAASPAPVAGPAPVAAPPDPVANVSTPGTPLTVSDRRAVRRIPVDTAIVVEQVNPKKPSTQSFDRYEAYKSATTVGGYLEKTSKGWSDFAYDFERGYISMPATAIMAVLPTFLVLALDAGSGFLCSDWAPVPVPLPPPDQPLTSRGRHILST